MGKTAQAPLMKNRHVKELLGIMEANHMDAGDLIAILKNVGQVERQLEAAVTELQAMRRELSDMREAQSHPVRRTMQGTVHAMEDKVSEALTRLEAVKNSMISGCKNAAAAFKEKGISTLDSLAGFFKIKAALQSLSNSLAVGIKTNENAIAKIEAVGIEYHEAGRHVKNMGRALSGKEAVPDAKPIGRLAKALEAPFRRALSCLTGAKKLAEAAIGRLEKLERAAEKPSVLETLHNFKREQAAQPKKEAPDQQKKTQQSL